MNAGNHAQSETNVEVEEIASGAPEVHFHGGDAFSISGATAITRNARTSVAVLAGGPNAGKTTVISSLYDRFLRGPFAGFSFKGSNTLLGFDERAFPGHTESRQAAPTTVHTFAGAEDVLLHLRLKGQADSHELLLADLSGEKFRLARDDVEEVRSSPLLMRSNHIAVLIDGARLVDRTTRDSEIGNVRMLIRSLVAGGAFDGRTYLQIVVSKWDLLAKDPAGEDLAAKATDAAINASESVPGKISTIRVAARPEESSAGLDWGHGVGDLLMEWVEISPAAGHAHQDRPMTSRRAFQAVGDT